MKSLAICLAMLSVAAVAVADTSEEVTNDNVVAVLRVDSTAVRTIVAVPWCAMSTNDEQSIQVSNVVKTANLTAGDELYAYDATSKKFDSWKLTAGTGGVLYWASAQDVSTPGEVNTVTESSIATVSRGTSLMLIRNGDLTKPFYLYGQVGTNSTVNSTISKGESGSSVYSLISNPKPEAWNPNDSDISWTVATGDSIQINWADGKNDILTRGTASGEEVWGNLQKTEEMYYEGSGIWKRAFTKYETQIPAGVGIWYISQGNTSSVIWGGVPVK